MAIVRFVASQQLPPPVPLHPLHVSVKLHHSGSHECNRAAGCNCNNCCCCCCCCALLLLLAIVNEGCQGCPKKAASASESSMIEDRLAFARGVVAQGCGTNSMQESNKTHCDACCCCICAPAALWFVVSGAVGKHCVASSLTPPLLTRAPPQLPQPPAANAWPPLLH